MGRKSKEAIRKQRYRERLRQRRASSDLDARVEDLRQLVKHDVPRDLLVNYVQVSDALDAELARIPHRTRAVQELVASKARLAELLDITPLQRRTAGVKDSETIGEALARSSRNVERIRAREWADLQEEIRMFAPKMIGDVAVHREDLIMAVGDLRRRRPELFTEAELSVTAEQLLDAVLAAAPAHPPSPQQAPTVEDSPET